MWTGRGRPRGQICLSFMYYPCSAPYSGSYIYTPWYSSVIFRKILAFVDTSPGTLILWIGNFNNSLHPYRDKFHTGTIMAVSRPTLARLLGEVGLRDLWRLRFPEVRQFSCYSPTHHFLSRIDLAVGSDSIIPLVGRVEYLTRDHSPIHVQLNLGQMGVPARRLWCLQPYGSNQLAYLR